MSLCSASDSLEILVTAVRGVLSEIAWICHGVYLHLFGQKIQLELYPFKRQNNSSYKEYDEFFHFIQFDAIERKCF